jgi:ribosomal protein S18 acetylase RimI-like enzyme
VSKGILNININVYFQAMYGEECVGAIVCKLDVHRKVMKRGYIAMLAVDEKHRKKRIGKKSTQLNSLIMRRFGNK